MCLEFTVYSAGYGRRVVVKNVNMACSPGKIVGLFGHNGAGKSTLLKAVTGLLPTVNAQVMLDGRSIKREEFRRLALVPQEHGVFPSMTVEENLRVASTLTVQEGLKKKKEEIFELFPALYEKRFQTAGSLSGGQQQMLKIALALVKEPRALFMDEPSTGLAPVVVEKIMLTLDQMKRTLQVPILLVEQNIKAALQVVDYVYVMRNGEIVLQREANGVDVEILWPFF